MRAACRRKVVHGGVAVGFIGVVLVLSPAGMASAGTVVDPVIVAGPVAGAVAPVASAVAGGPSVPGGDAVRSGGGPAPVTTRAPTPGGTGATPPGGSGAGTTTPAAGGAGGVTGSVAAAPGSAVLPAADSPGRTTAGTTDAGYSGAGRYLPTSGGQPSGFWSPVLADFHTSGPAAYLGSFPVGTAASESSVQALDSALGSRPALVVFVAVLALAATAGCTVRQWVLRALPTLAAVPVTRGAHRR